jgi:hypothetical protein
MLVRKRKMAYLICILFAMQLVLNVSYAESASVSIKETSDPNIIDISGAGFDAQEKVNVELFQNTIKIYTSTENITTTTSGNFTSPINIPSGLSGKYNFTASTSSKIASGEYTLQSSKPASEISATPNNSNIVKVFGKRFNSSETVTLELWNATARQYSFPDNVTTDLEGNFSTVVIIPTSLRRDYFLVASTASSQAYVNYAVPDLNGATGVKGAAGEAASNTLVYIAIAISLVSILISYYALKKQSPQQRVIKDQRKKRR